MRLLSALRGNAPNPIPELVVDGASINAAIAAANESDLYRFTITTGGIYTIQTTGTTDTFMTLHGQTVSYPKLPAMTMAAPLSMHGFVAKSHLANISSA